MAHLHRHGRAAAPPIDRELNALLEAKFEFVLGQSFAFLGKQMGMETARRKRAQLSATDDTCKFALDPAYRWQRACLGEESPSSRKDGFFLLSAS